MFSRLRATVSARINSPHYLSLVRDGAGFRIGPDSPLVRVKIVSIGEEDRPVGYRFSRFSIHAVAQTSQGVETHGFGEDENKLVATQKALSEATERAVFRSVKKVKDIQSSNGWACHPDLEQAIEGAKNELIERDSAFAHWHRETPLLEISNLPGWLSTWKTNELSLAGRFNQLRVMVGTLGHRPHVSIFILDRDNCGFVSHASSHDLETSVRQALTEVTRIASIRVQGDHSFPSESPRSPIEHAFYFRDRPFPAWIFGEGFTFKQIRQIFKERSKSTRFPFTKDIYICGKLFIVQVRSSEVQDVYFGRYQDGISKNLINLTRLRTLGIQEVRNPMPHFIP